MTSGRSARPDRADQLRACAGHSHGWRWGLDHDLIIVGGGINGAGIARDAALRGMRVCLVEQADFCNSTSRWSSRLIHGGLRYLEHAEFSLVRESLAERETLLATAPHLVRPLPLLVPIYRGARRGRAAIRAGMWLYDALSSGKSLPRHRMLDVPATLAGAPGLRGEGLLGAASYFDAQATFPERLVLENLLAARAAGAELRSYTRAERVLVEAGRVIGVQVSNPRTGRASTIRAPLVVNAAGPWVDRLLASLPGRRLRPLIGGSRGTHIVVDPLAGLGDAACYAEAAADGRPFFIIPWNGLTLIGTTDIACESDPARVRAEAAEIDYLLAETARLFPGARLSREAIHYCYTGVRPLPAATPDENQAAITRRHHVRHHRLAARGLYSIIGGKLTTYRSLAEQVVDRLSRKLRRELRSCVTAREALPGAIADPAPLCGEVSGHGGIEPAAALRLVSLYGTRAQAVAELARRSPALRREICPRSHAIAAEIVFAFECEMAQTLADGLMRRTMLGLAADRGAGVLEAALDVARAELGWTRERVEEERRTVEAEREALALR